MVDVFEHSARLDTAAIEERRDLVQVVPDGGKLPCDSFDLVRVDIEHIRERELHWCRMKRRIHFTQRLTVSGK